MSLLNSELNLSICNVISMSWERSSVNVEPRTHHALVYRVKGNADFICGGKKISTKEGDVFYMPSGVGYHANYTKDNEVLVIHFNSTYVGEAENFTPENAIAAKRLFTKATELWEKKESGNGFACLAAVYELLAYLCRNGKETCESLAHKSFLSAVEFLNAHYTDSSISVEGLATSAHMSGTYFRRLFIRRFGIPPQQYLTNLRLRHAVSLLIEGKRSVNEAATLSGFSDPKYFSRVVRKVYGVPPSKLGEYTV